VIRNTTALRHLAIERKTRDLILVLISNQLAAEQATDLIPSKGNGLIMLLHGGPGTGKTLTSEIVAEVAKKPPYRDVGTETETIGKDLESVLCLYDRT
jgi:replication-associated recombination protein RarA